MITDVWKNTTNLFWCRPCNSFQFKKEFDQWTSGNKDVDEFLQRSQLGATSKFEILEWISFEKFNNIEKIGEGGFSKVYLAEWNEGDIKFWKKYSPWEKYIDFSGQDGRWERSGKIKVALKCLNDSQEISKEFLEEVKNLYKLNNESQITRCYGITKDKRSNFMIVMKFVNHTNAIHKLSWYKKFRRLHFAALGLYKIHEADLVHRDFHLGNVLFSKENDAVYITDLGLCKPANFNEREDTLYGVLPYVAPEVLRNKKHTKAADIYSFGMIMYKVFSGVHPFNNVNCDDVEESKILAIEICDGKRPEIKDLPPLIAELTKKCWDANPERRPSAEDLCKILNAWKYFHSDSELAKQIKASDVNQTHQLTSLISEQIQTSQLLCTSKLLDFKNLPQPKNS